MSDEHIGHDPARRRWWLLTKALERAPLAEALRLARAAEEFIDGVGLGELAPAVALIEPHPSALQVARTDMTVPVAPSDPSDDAPASPQSDAEPEPHLAPARNVSADAARPMTGDQDAPPPGSSDALVVLAGVDDVVRYLRRRDEVVVPTADGAFLVNGRSRESLEELFQRANRMRARDQLPQFVSLPESVPARAAPVRITGTSSDRRLPAEHDGQLRRPGTSWRSSTRGRLAGGT